MHTGGTRTSIYFEISFGFIGNLIIKRKICLTVYDFLFSISWHNSVNAAEQHRKLLGFIQTLTEKSIAIQNMRGQGYYRLQRMILVRKKR